MYFPRPADFNDPFDCKVRLLFKASRLKRERYSRDLVRERAPHLPKHQQKEMAKHGVSLRSWQNAHDRFLKHLGERVGVLSFSEKPDNILMWSHYAEKHTGLCVEFRRVGYLASNALKVQYSHDYPELDFFEITDALERDKTKRPELERKVVDRVYLTKSKDWEYESEWRIIDPVRGFGLKIFPTDLITRIILGCRMSREDKTRVAEWVRGGPAKAEICEARASETSFELEFVDPYKRSGNSVRKQK
jgi:hypothetical protein